LVYGGSKSKKIFENLDTKSYIKIRRKENKGKFRKRKISQVLTQDYS
jgi:hypothetical protein